MRTAIITPINDHGKTESPSLKRGAGLSQQVIEGGLIGSLHLRFILSQIRHDGLLLNAVKDLQNESPPIVIQAGANRSAYVIEARPLAPTQHR